MTKSRVAALRVEPSTILESIQRLCELAGMKDTLAAGRTTILKDNISWHFPFPAANTTPWQLEGTILALRAAGLIDLSCVQNKTVVTDAFKGEDLNHYLPVLARYGVPILYNFREGDMKWIEYRPKARMHVLNDIYPDGIRIPDYFPGKNIVHLPTVKCVSGDTEVALADGSFVKIRELVATQIGRSSTVHLDADGTCQSGGSVSILAMDQSGRIRPFEAKWFSRSPVGSRSLRRIKTRTGHTLTGSGDHRIWTPDGWIPLQDLRIGTRVGQARAHFSGGASQALPQRYAAPISSPVEVRAGYSTEFIQGAVEVSASGQSTAAIAAVAELSTPRIARDLLDSLASADRGNRFSGEIADMRLLMSEDLAWDVVVTVESVDGSESELFDLTVPDAGCFIGNGLVLHNCHIYTTTTGAMKNAFGGLLHTHRHYTHSWIHRALVDLLAIQKEIHTGVFAVMDGTTAGNGPGPRTMFPVVKNVMLASSDQVAIDAVAAKLMGFDPLSLEYIRVAHEDRLGVGDPRDIEIVGDDVSGESWGFKVGDNGASLVGDLLWFSPLKRFQKLFFRTPLVNLFIFGSETYHDYYRWPLKDRRVFDKWRQETGWGRLFDRYAGGPIAPGAAGMREDRRPAAAPSSLRPQE